MESKRSAYNGDLNMQRCVHDIYIIFISTGNIIGGTGMIIIYNGVHIVFTLYIKLQGI